MSIRNVIDAKSQNPFASSSASLKRAAVAEKKAETLQKKLKEKEKEQSSSSKRGSGQQPLSKEAAEFVFSKLTPKSSKHDKERYGLIVKITQYYEKFAVAPSSRKTLAQLSKMKLDQLQSEYRSLEQRRASSMSVRLVRMGWSWFTKTTARGLAEMSQNADVAEMTGGWRLNADLIDHAVEKALEEDQELNDDLMEFAIKYSGMLELAVHWRLLIHSGSIVYGAHVMAEQERRETQYRKYAEQKVNNNA